MLPIWLITPVTILALSNTYLTIYVKNSKYFGKWARSMSGKYKTGSVIYQSVISRNTACLFPLLSQPVHTQWFHYSSTSLCIIFHSRNVSWLFSFLLHIVKTFSICSQPWVCESESILSYFALKQTSDPSNASKQMLSAQNLNTSPNHVHPEIISTERFIFQLDIKNV